jgi:Flp pilus assembly protein TadD
MDRHHPKQAEMIHRCKFGGRGCFWHWGGSKSRAGVLAVTIVCATLSIPSVIAQQTSELAQAAALIRQGRFDLAEQRLQRVLLRQPHSAKAGNLLGIVYLRQRRYDEAERSLRRATHEDPKLVDSFRNLGETYIAEGKAEAAESAYGDAVKLVPGDAKSNVALAILYQGAGDYQRSLDAAGRIAPAQRTPNLLPILAADYVGLNQSEKAELEIRGMLHVAAKNPELVPQFAGFLLDRGAVGDADELLKTAAKIQKPTDKFLYQVARVEALQGNRAQARQTLADVLERSPDFLDALVEAGRLAGLDSDWKQAAELLEYASQLAPQRVDILQGLVTAQLDSHRSAGALRTSRKLMALQPDDLRSFYFLALAQAGNQQWPEAKSSAEKVLQTHPEDREMNLTLAAAAYNMNDLAEARKRLEVCLGQNRSDAGALYFLGLIQKTEGDSASAIQTLSNSVAIDPKNAEAQSALGGLYLQQGDLLHARDALEQAVRVWPEGADNHYKLALVYTRSGLPDKAKQQLEIYKKEMETLSERPKTSSPPNENHPMQP